MAPCFIIKKTENELVEIVRILHQRMGKKNDRNKEYRLWFMLVLLLPNNFIIRLL